MSNSPIASTPRFLLFPQVDRAEPQGKRPVVRRYSLTLLPSTGTDRPKRARSAPRGLTAA
ncbi:MAG TPA: hypothetical protein VHW26_13930 [Solirubrobacteraceae bacterium]|jgi:hypothetical protein|nr:hypothetical protein [Solirubrobacteraceae bacterium]